MSPKGSTWVPFVRYEDVDHITLVWSSDLKNVHKIFGRMYLERPRANTPFVAFKGKLEISCPINFRCLDNHSSHPGNRQTPTRDPTTVKSRQRAPSPRRGGWRRNANFVASPLSIRLAMPNTAREFNRNVATHSRDGETTTKQIHGRIDGQEKTALPID